MLPQEFRCFSVLIFITPGLFADDQRQLSLNCDEKSVCALEGSSVALSCSYTVPANSHQGKNTFYCFNNDKRMPWKNKTIPQPLEKDPDYTGRLGRRGQSSVDSLGTQAARESVIIQDLRTSDSALYRCRLETKNYGWKMSESGVTLSVTGLQVKVSPTTQRIRGTLTCLTSCDLGIETKYRWYRNGLLLSQTGMTLEYPNAAGTEAGGSYSCAIEGREDLRSPAVSLSPSSLPNPPV